MQTSIHEAISKLSPLIEPVIKGEEAVYAKLEALCRSLTNKQENYRMITRIGNK